MIAQERYEAVSYHKDLVAQNEITQERKLHIFDFRIPENPKNWAYTRERSECNVRLPLLLLVGELKIRIPIQTMIEQFPKNESFVWG